MADASQGLDDLHAQWSSCVACELGVRRAAQGGHYVPGEGTTRAVMFVGPAPNREDEEWARPFVPAGDTAGIILRGALKKIGLENYYVTHLVGCRPCEPLLDRQSGQPVLRKDRRTGRELPVIVDKAPPPVGIAACRERLLEEIYRVDPVVIVTLGTEAAEALLGRAVPLTRERGIPQQIEIPGALYRPTLTDKKRSWVRKVLGAVRAPVEPNGVRYLVLPTIHPDFVRKRGADRGASSPAVLFGADLRRARDLYDRYCVEALGHEPWRYGAEQQEGDIYAQDEE